MTEERRLELIHAEIDGRISDPERAELDALLGTEPATRQLRDDLRIVADRLAELPQVEPPATLRQAIHAALPARARQDVGPRLGERLRSWLATPATFKLAGAFAAGLAVGAIVLSPDAGMDLRQLTGTMAAYESGEDDAIARLTMDEPDVAGSVGIHHRGALYVIEYDLSTEQPVDVVTDYSGANASFNGFAHIGDSDTRAVAEGRRVRLTIDGHRRYAIFLRRPKGGEGQIEIGFYAGDKLLHSGNLRVPAVAQAP